MVVVVVFTVQEVRWSLVAAVRLLCLLRAPWPDWAGLGWAGLAGLGWLGWARLGSADAAEGGPGPALAPGPRQDHRRGCLKLQTCTYHIQTSYIVYRR